MDSTSPFGNLYLSIMDRLVAEVAALRYIDQDLGQLDNYDIRPAVSFPCALIDISDFESDDMAGKNMQHAEGLVIITLGFDPFSASNSLAPGDVRLKALEYYDIEQAVHVALHGWRNEGFSKLLRRKAIKEGREDKFRVRKIAYATSFEDDTTMPVLASLPRPEPFIGKDVL